jgi:hypothetical protein
MAALKRSKKVVKNPVIDLDGLYRPEEIALWLHLTRRSVMDLVRLGKLPVVKLNDRVFRFHPRTILVSKGQRAA